MTVSSAAIAEALAGWAPDVYAVLDEVAPPDPKDEESAERAALARRKQQISPEVVAGDEAAVAELAEIESRLSELDRQAGLKKLAEAETANRERAAAEAERERQRATWAAECDALEEKQDKELAKVEKALGGLVDAIKAATDLGHELERISRQLDPQSHRGRIRSTIEHRLARRLHEVGMQDIGFVLHNGGLEPLGKKPRG